MYKLLIGTRLFTLVLIYAIIGSPSTIFIGLGIRITLSRREAISAAVLYGHNCTTEMRMRLGKTARVVLHLLI